MGENPPAFPNKLGFGTDAGDMSLRDYFAAQALPRTLSADYYDSSEGFKVLVDGELHERAAAEAAYRIADAMLLERERRNG